MRTEVMAGITTFITVAYILILAPVVGIIPSAATAPALIFVARYAFITLG